MRTYTFFAFLLFKIIPFCNILNAQQFRSIERQAGLDHIIYTNGIAVADYDLDNDLDIFIIAQRDFEEGSPETWNRLFRNNNNGRFEDVTVSAGFGIIENNENAGEKLAASWGDYNNDNYPDLFISTNHKSQLYRNNKDGTFTNVTAEAGITEYCELCFYSGALWVDLNNDTYLDLYITDFTSTIDNKLYLNNGDGSFTLKSNTNLNGSAYSLSSIPIDFNGDEFLDIYVANDVDQNNYLLINQNGDGFIEVAQDYGMESPHNGMGLATPDYNNDGLFELIVTNIRENNFYVQTGTLDFEDKATDLGIFNTGWAWGASFSDFTHDGYEDLYIANGYFSETSDFYLENIPNIGGRTFQRKEPVLGGDSEKTNGRAIVSFDYDNDGDLDVIKSNVDGHIVFHENTSIDTYYTNETQGNWLKIKLQSTSSNNYAVGAKLGIYYNNGAAQHRFHHGAGYQSQSILPVHFGLSNTTVVDSLSITWPSGNKETRYNIPVNKTIKVVEGNDFVVEDNNTAVLIPGCTDIDSCNYNPNATFNNGSCEYIPSGTLSGNAIANVLTNEAYSYALAMDSNTTFEWHVENGEIISGQGTNSVSVHWFFGSSGKITVRANNEECFSLPVTLDVTLEYDAESSNNNYSVARLWNEALLEAIRKDYARPTIHARNLFHTSIAMYDAWAIYNEGKVEPYFIGKKVHDFQTDFDGFTSSESSDISLQKTISYAAYTLLKHRFQKSPNAEITLAKFNNVMQSLGYDIDFTSQDYASGDPAALGNYIGTKLIEYGLQDGANEAGEYENLYYEPINSSLIPANGGSTMLSDPNRWQPLSLDVFIDQSGNITRENTPQFLSPEWGNVNAFALNESELTSYSRNSSTYRVYHDPLSPPQLGNSSTDTEQYQWGFSLVSIWGAHLSPHDGVLWDISPKSIGNIYLSAMPDNFADYPSFYKTFEGGDVGIGRAINPYTKQPYETQIVPRGDYARVLAEFWADGPDSETPPGHWFVLLNYVSDHPVFEKRFKGEGAILSNLEWDVKSYFILGGAMHDAAIAAWSIKGWYDYIRPISAIRYMAEIGQSSDNGLDNFHEEGIPLIDGYIEVVEEGDVLAGSEGEHVGKIKLYTWRGHDYIDDTETEEAGVGWILAENWWPYQRPSFVTPPFAGYVSGHSTYSRAAAEIITKLTGDEYFPGGLGEFLAKKNEFLVFEEGPSEDVILQWATYRDASDQCSLSRIWGGIHPPMDDIPGRIIGEKIGVNTFEFAEALFDVEKPEANIKNMPLFVYPNPISLPTSIKVKHTLGNEEFELFDFLGKQLSVNASFNEENNETEIRIHSPLKTGIYILRTEKKSWKLVIQ